MNGYKLERVLRAYSRMHRQGLFHYRHALLTEAREKFFGIELRLEEIDDEPSKILKQLGFGERGELFFHHHAWWANHNRALVLQRAGIKHGVAGEWEKGIWLAEHSLERSLIVWIAQKAGLKIHKFKHIASLAKAGHYPVKKDGGVLWLPLDMTELYEKVLMMEEFYGKEPFDSFFVFSPDTYSKQQDAIQKVVGTTYTRDMLMRALNCAGFIPVADESDGTVWELKTK